MRGLHVPSGQHYTGMNWSEMQDAVQVSRLLLFAAEASFNALNRSDYL